MVDTTTARLRGSLRKCEEWVTAYEYIYAYGLHEAPDVLRNHAGELQDDAIALETDIGTIRARDEIENLRGEAEHLFAAAKKAEGLESDDRVSEWLIHHQRRAYELRKTIRERSQNSSTEPSGHTAQTSEAASAQTPTAPELTHHSGGK